MKRYKYVAGGIQKNGVWLAPKKVADELNRLQDEVKALEKGKK